MLDAILKWLAPWLLRKLTAILDPEAAARAERLLGRSNELDEAEKALAIRETAFHDRLVESDKKVSEWQRRTAELDGQISELGNKFAADTEVRKDLENDLAKREKDIADRPVVDRIELDLPGTGSKTR